MASLVKSIPFRLLGAGITSLSLTAHAVQIAPQGMAEIEVWGKESPTRATDYSSPSSILTQKDLISINAATTEDLVKYEPSLVIRRRFIGDSNGTLGIRGSNMFQTARSMVFADGVPLHYLLQTRWSGAPRWSLVSADEIAEVKVVYGPYSAEYSGNAMGGAVNIETAIPTERQFHVEGSLFQQNYDELGFDDDLDGFKGFVSYGDRIGDFSFYTSYNRLENDSQPQNFRFDRSTDSASGSETIVTGAELDKDEYGNQVPYFADTGMVDTTTDHFKIKLGFHQDNWSALLNMAYENRESVTDSPNNYLVTEDGQPVWSGTVAQDGIAFDVSSRNFSVSEQDRQSLLLGGRLQGHLTEDWWLSLNLSYFEILEDERRASKANPLDPVYTAAGQVTDYEDTGWETVELRLQNDQFLGRDALSLLTGLRYEHYSLEINSYNSDNYRSGEKNSLRSTSGGETDILAFYTQLGWQISEQWDMGLGLRYESWESEDGFYGNVQHSDRSENKASPKFTIGYEPNDQWQFRYSVAKAYRFPIVEELFQNERRTNGTSLANANLEPEDGFHHNLSVERSLAQGFLRFNLFHETIDDVIFAQTTVVDNISINTFIPIDTVTTKGAEFVFNQYNLLDMNVDLRFNMTYADSEIRKNQANTTLEGKRFPRMPKWRANLLLTYHITPQWNIGGGIRYASNSYGDLDNRDRARNVFGAQDGYTFINLKTNYQINDHYRISLGIDNITNEIAYVHHPWPGRTVFIEGAAHF